MVLVSIALGISLYISDSLECDDKIEIRSYET